MSYTSTSKISPSFHIAKSCFSRSNCIHNFVHWPSRIPCSHMMVIKATATILSPIPIKINTRVRIFLLVGLRHFFWFKFQVFQVAQGCGNIYHHQMHSTIVSYPLGHFILKKSKSFVFTQRGYQFEQQMWNLQDPYQSTLLSGLYFWQFFKKNWVQYSILLSCPRLWRHLAPPNAFNHQQFSLGSLSSQRKTSHLQNWTFKEVQCVPMSQSFWGQNPFLPSCPWLWRHLAPSNAFNHRQFSPGSLSSYSKATHLQNWTFQEVQCVPLSRILLGPTLVQAYSFQRPLQKLSPMWICGLEDTKWQEFQRQHDISIEMCMCVICVDRMR